MLYPHSLFAGLLALAGSARGHALAQAPKPWPGHRTSVQRRLALVVLTLAVLLAVSPPLFAQTVVATINVGNGPSGVAVNPATNRAYVVNYGDDTVSVIQE
jgi:hypothetical protein